MVSHPQYNPASLASHDLQSVQAAWKKLNADPGRPAVNRTIAGDLYPPGSTFKLVTAAAALSTGKYTEDSVVPGPASLDLPLTTTNLPNDDGLPCGPGGQSTLTRALERSCNTHLRRPRPQARRRRAAHAGGQVRLRRRAARADAGQPQLGARDS